MGMKHESLAKWLKDGFIFEPVKRSGNADSLVDGSLMEKVFGRRSLQMRNMQRAWEFANLLTPEEQTLRQKVRACVEKEIAPIMTKYWEKAEFPFQIVLKLGALNIVGGTTKSYGCPGLSVTTNALVTAEIASVDASYSSGL